ncbi:hypothetical protein D3C76_1106400 [compost metagenome]
MLKGTNTWHFEPDRPIKREEAAVIIRNLLVLSGYTPSDKSSTALAPGTSKWAEEAVKTIIDLKIYGPEVFVKNGRVDYGSQRTLTKQELTAIQYLH